MRSTRNAAKGTPPSAKKAGKGTPGKTTPKVEKKEDNVKAEKKEDNVNTETVPVAASESDAVLPESSASVDVKPEDVGALDESKQEKSEGAETIDTVEDEESKPKSPEEEIAQDSLKVSDKAIEESKESVMEGEKAVEETKESALADVVTDTSKGVEEADTTKEVSGGEDTEMQETTAEDQVEAAGNEEGEEDDEEDDDEDDDDDEDEEGDDELVEPRPVSERQKRKKLEVFVGGLDKEATVEEVKKIFEAVGDVQEVRLMTHPQTGKNRGYAFVRFATMEQAVRAASELDRTKIRGKECAVVPSEDNDTLFVGNICKSWTSEQVSEKLKEYGVEGIDEMVLVEDLENAGHNRGHTFLEFVTHSDAIKAFKRLSKPDAIFGSDRSAKVAWAEGASGPDDSVMAKVKSVFVSGMPDHWDNDNIKEHFGKFGDIERIVLAKNISRSKRTDFAFVNFATRDASTAAIEALNDAEVTDGDNKVKLKVELSKPTPRKKRMRGHRGSYPVGGRPSKKRGDQRRGEGSRGDQKKGGGGRADQRRGEGGRASSHLGREGRLSSQKNFRGTKRKAAEDRPLPQERSRDRHNRGPRNARPGAAVPKGNSNARGGSSRRGRTGAYSDEEYMPLGARISPGFMPPRGYGRPPREAAYPLRAERDVAYSGLGAKRSYSAIDEEAAYYGSERRSYPRARVDYAEPALYSDPLRAASLGHGSLGHVLPRGGHGYTSVIPGAADYSAYAPAGATDPRGAAYPSTYYGSRGGSGYSLPSGSGPYY